jgi:hypothetical protein
VPGPLRGTRPTYVGAQSATRDARRSARCGASPVRRAGSAQRTRRPRRTSGGFRAADPPAASYVGRVPRTGPTGPRRTSDGFRAADAPAPSYVGRVPRSGPAGRVVRRAGSANRTHRPRRTSGGFRAADPLAASYVGRVPQSGPPPASYVRRVPRSGPAAFAVDASTAVCGTRTFDMVIGCCSTSS